MSKLFNEFNVQFFKIFHLFEMGLFHNTIKTSQILCSYYNLFSNLLNKYNSFSNLLIEFMSFKVLWYTYNELYLILLKVNKELSK